MTRKPQGQRQWQNSALTSMQPRLHLKEGDKISRVEKGFINIGNKIKRWKMEAKDKVFYFKLISVFDRSASE